MEMYILERVYRVKQEEGYLKQPTAGVSQGSVLGPVLCLLFTYFIPEMINVKIANMCKGS